MYGSWSVERTTIQRLESVLSAFAVENEQQVAGYRHQAKQRDGSHAKTCEDRECGCESEEIDPGHGASFNAVGWRLTGASMGDGCERRMEVAVFRGWGSVQSAFGLRVALRIEPR